MTSIMQAEELSRVIPDGNNVTSFPTSLFVAVPLHVLGSTIPLPRCLCEVLAFRTLNRQIWAGHTPLNLHPESEWLYSDVASVEMHPFTM